MLIDSAPRPPPTGFDHGFIRSAITPLSEATAFGGRITMMAAPVLDRVDVLHPVAEGTRSREYHHALQWESHVGGQDVDLLGYVDVDRALSDQVVLVGKTGCRQCLVVVLLDGAYEAALPRGDLAALWEDGGVFLIMTATPDDQGQAPGLQHRF